MRDFFEVLREAGPFGLSRDEQFRAYGNHYSAAEIAEVRERALAAGHAVERRELGTGGRARLVCYAADRAPEIAPIPAPRPRRAAKPKAPKVEEYSPSTRHPQETVLPAKPRLEVVGAVHAEPVETYREADIFAIARAVGWGDGSHAHDRGRSNDTAELAASLGLGERMPEPLPPTEEDSTTPFLEGLSG